MRQRKIKNVEEKIAEYNYMIPESPESLKGNWKNYFDSVTDFFSGCMSKCTSNSKSESEDPFGSSCNGDGASSGGKLFLEIGCGKGDFISAIAKDNPEYSYIAVEGLASVTLRALEKVNQAELNNVRFITEYIRDMDAFFDKEELDGLFLNFSDPWPKNRNAKRRLTHGKRLIQYSESLKPGGFIRFKTDNRELFDFSVDEIKENMEAAGLTISYVTYDLRNPEDEEALKYAKESPITEYESKFMAQGKSICFIELIKK